VEETEVLGPIRITLAIASIVFLAIGAPSAPAQQVTIAAAATALLFS